MVEIILKPLISDLRGALVVYASDVAQVKKHPELGSHIAKLWWFAYFIKQIVETIMKGS